MSTQLPKIAIIGAGPAGTTLSLFLSKKNIPHYLIDKSTFPRDKVCGDGLTNEVLKVLNLLNPEWLNEFLSLDFVSGVNHVLFENARASRVVLNYDKSDFKYQPFYIAKRERFDAWLFSKVDSKYAQVITGKSVKDVSRVSNQVKLVLEGGEEITVDLVVGADGERSVVRKQFHPEGIKKIKEHSSGGLRQYYVNIESPFEYPSLEIYQLKEGKLGYFWIFYLPNNEANVGIGALAQQPKGIKLKLREELNSFIASHPQLKERFRNAKPTERPVGWGLPFNSNAYHYSGENFALIGDAASMIEPLTGKGIGVSMFAAKYLAETIQEAIGKDDFSAKKMKSYEVEIEKKFRKEWNQLYRFQKMSKYNRAISFLLSVINIKWVKGRIEKSYIDKIQAFVERP